MPEITAMLIVWIVLLIVFVILEALTTQLTTIWFALGAVAAIISYMFDAATWIQWVVFTLVSLIALAVTRPFVKRITNKQKTRTNADMVIGKTAVVETAIDNTLSQGTVKVNGNIWTARSESGDIIPAGSSVVVMRIDGVKLIVDKI